MRLLTGLGPFCEHFRPKSTLVSLLTEKLANSPGLSFSLVFPKVPKSYHLHPTPYLLVIFSMCIFASGQIVLTALSRHFKPCSFPLTSRFFEEALAISHNIVVHVSSATGLNTACTGYPHAFVVSSPFRKATSSASHQYCATAREIVGMYSSDGLPVAAHTQGRRNCGRIPPAGCARKSQGSWFCLPGRCDRSRH